MLSNWLIVPLMLIAEAWSTRRDTKIRFLKLQLELYRVKMPGNRVILAPEERQRLLRLDDQVGHQVDDLIGIMNVKTYRRWLREQQGAGNRVESAGRDIDRQCRRPAARCHSR